MTPYYEQDRVMLYQGDCRAVLATLPAHSVDAVLTDPPAGIAFMGKTWDDAKGGRDQWVAWLAGIMRECKRVMLPGAHALVWALPRTSHWTATALEDAGFTVRDVITHHFGSGFPKSANISAHLDKMAGAEREVVGIDHDFLRRNPHRAPQSITYNDTYADGAHAARITAPATDLAKQWDGWGSALKPASEHWILARAPLSEPTLAANVAKHGTGGLNIDGCRIAAQSGDYAHPGNANRSEQGAVYASPWSTRGEQKPPHSAGRWPANVLLSHTLWCQPRGTRQVKGNTAPTPSATRPGGRTEYRMSASYEPVGYADANGLETVEAWDCAPECPVALLDGQSGVSRSENRPRMRNTALGRMNDDGWQPTVQPRKGHEDTGGASRFFYCAKPSAAERSRGLPNGERNDHPTVKPIALARYLARLITPPDGLVLDPFMGSGSLGCGVLAEGFLYLGVEQDSHYCDLARQRLTAVLPLEVGA